MDVEILDPLIYVYHDAFPDPEEYIERINALDEWQSWYTFGEQVHLGGIPVMYNTFPTREEWDATIADHLWRTKRPHLEPLLEVFYQTSSHYVKETGAELPNWIQTNPGLCKYYPDTSIHGFHNLAMHYHTDYQQDAEPEPGNKFAITSTMYLNDDYDGGEISFKVYDENDENFTLIDYKPRKGDVVIFEARHPYYHGVRTVRGGEKYFIRTNWCYYYSGDPEWLAERERYPEDVWKQMEAKRKDEGRRANRWTRSD